MEKGELVGNVGGERKMSEKEKERQRLTKVCCKSLAS